MKRNLVTLMVIMILEDTAAFHVLFLVSLFCASTSAFTYSKVKSVKCLVFTSGGLGLGLKNLVLFTSLV